MLVIKKSILNYINLDKKVRDKNAKETKKLQKNIIGEIHQI